jgi:hypothetical protein
MTAKITADAAGTKVLIGNAAENALEIDSTAKTIKALSPYQMNATDTTKVPLAGGTMTGPLSVNVPSDLGLTITGSNEGGEIALRHTSGRYATVDYLDAAQQLRLINWASGSPAIINISSSADISTAGGIAATNGLYAGALSTAGVSTGGATVTNAGTIELYGSPPFIDFKRSPVDYSWRLINEPADNSFRIQCIGGGLYTFGAVGGVNLLGDLTVSGKYLGPDANGGAMVGTYRDGAHYVGFGWNGSQVLGLVDNTVEVQLGVSSDIRVKENIQDLPSVLDKVSQLRPVSFNYKSNGLPSIGFIAQEFGEVFPELRHISPSSQESSAMFGSDPIQSVNYAQVVAVLTKAIQELTARVAELEAK